MAKETLQQDSAEEFDDWRMRIFTVGLSDAEALTVANGNGSARVRKRRRLLLRRRPHGRRSRVRRVLTSRTLAWSMVLLAAAGGAAVYLTRPVDLSSRVHALGRRLASSRTSLLSANAQIVSARSEASQLQSEVSGQQMQITTLQSDLDKLRASKVKTVVHVKTVTKTETRWIPDGQMVTVETTGFEGMVEIHDVQLTNSFGYTDLVGIAINRSGQTFSYAELGCTFLDGDGKVTGNAIDNKTNWAPDASWGFDCSGQASATGGIIRVDELS